jgi:CrcB protein
VLGACARLGLSDALPAEEGGWPVATFVANVVGSLLMGALVAGTVRRGREPSLVSTFLGAGVLGGFTTFSAVSEEVRSLLDARPVLGLGYAVTTAGVTVAAAGAGFEIVRRLLHRRRGDEPGWQP